MVSSFESTQGVYLGAFSKVDGCISVQNNCYCCYWKDYRDGCQTLCLKLHPKHFAKCAVTEKWLNCCKLQGPHLRKKWVLSDVGQNAEKEFIPFPDHWCFCSPSSVGCQCIDDPWNMVSAMSEQLILWTSVTTLVLMQFLTQWLIR